MIIEKIIIGNKEEAYVENRLTSKFNIISSNENNKGKTIVLQSAMYALGNIPTFPKDFDFKNYYHIIVIKINNKRITICRKNNTYFLKNNDNVTICETKNELKNVLNKVGLKLPSITKDDMERIVDPELFLQLFFVPQDKKNTSSIMNKGFYKNDDFINMLYSYSGKISEIKDDDIKEIRNKINNLTEKEKILVKESKIYKKINLTKNFSYNYLNKKEFEKKLDKLNQYKCKIQEYEKERNKIVNKKIQNENILEELASLNRTIANGKLKCNKCNSTDIVYETETGDNIFPISNFKMRNNIIDAIKSRNNTLDVKLNDINHYIEEYQNKMKDTLKDEDISIENLLMYKDDIRKIDDYDKELADIYNKINNLKRIMNEKIDHQNNYNNKKDEFIKDIIKIINDAYKLIDPQSEARISKLFTNGNETYSGSEGTVFYLSKLYAFQKKINHDYPIIMDSFRDNELSTDKEQRVIELFNSIKNQIIFSVTLKKQEINKYKNMKIINNIVYDDHNDFHLLDKKYVSELLEYLKLFDIYL